MPDYRHARSGSLNVTSPSSSAAQPASMATTAASTPRFDGPRSPPNTSHVPCKFFRQGACQAGNACPFSHDLGAAAENVCKYFAKGNCKFGPKCANIHVLPDGRRINYGKNGVTIGAAPINLTGRTTNPTSPQNQPSTSALTNSLYRAEVPAYNSAYPYDERQPSLGRQPSLENGLPTIDMSYTESAYGSPRDEESHRFGLGLSPVNGKGLSVLDAPLPASFDSNGISNAARFPAAPWPSSVPSKFGLESPSQSLSNAKDSRTSETLKLLHTSAFGSSEHLIAPIPNSPPNGEEYFGKRAMHSSRFSKPRMLSSSVPKTASIDRDWEPDFAFGEDDDTLPENYVPENLQDLLTPAEKARRGSMRADSSDAGLDGLSKYGSPIGSSPSRWGPMFQRQKDEEDVARSARNAASPFGHVGSPLRNSVLAQEMDKNASSLARPSSLRSTSESMSMLSQQLQRSRLDDAPSGASPMLHPSTARAPVSALSPISPIGKERGMERHVSSGSISSSMNGRFTTPINEDDEMFHMEGMEEDGESAVSKTPKRTSAGLSMGAWGGSYAGVVAGKGATNGTKGSRDSVPVSGR